MSPETTILQPVITPDVHRVNIYSKNNSPGEGNESYQKHVSGKKMSAMTQSPTHKIVARSP